MPRLSLDAVLRVLFVLLLLVAGGCNPDAASEDGPDGEGEVATEASDESTTSDENAAEAEDQGEDSDEESSRRERSTTVTVSPVTRGELVLPVIAEGSIRARHATDIKFEFGPPMMKQLMTELQGELARLPA